MNFRFVSSNRTASAGIVPTLAPCDAKSVQSGRPSTSSFQAPPTKWSSPERLEQLLKHCKPRERRLLIFLTYTGARLSEVLRVDWDKDIRLAERTVVLRRTKNGEMRTVHVPDPLLIELAAVPEANRFGPLFDYTDKTRVYAPLRRACAKAGVDYLPPHQQGRHTYATWLRTYGGLDLVGLKEAGGWKSIASVARYAHVTPNEAARAPDRMPSVQSSSSGTRGK